MRKLLLTTCALAAIPAFGHFDHEDPLPHALQSDFVELRAEVGDARREVNDAIADMKSGIEYESLGPRSGRRTTIRFVEEGAQDPTSPPKPTRRTTTTWTTFRRADLDVRGATGPPNPLTVQHP